MNRRHFFSAIVAFLTWLLTGKKPKPKESELVRRMRRALKKTRFQPPRRRSKYMIVTTREVLEGIERMSWRT